MSRQLILIRHSIVVQNSETSSNLWPLSENGRSLCHTLAPQIASYRPTQFITSSEAKAVETGQIIAGALDVPCQTAPGLHEHDRTGAPYLPDKAAFAALIARFFGEPETLVFGRETAVQAQTRFIKAVNAVMTTHPTGNMAIVTHGTVLTLFAKYYQSQLDPLTFWKSLTLPCAFITDWPQVDTLTRI